MSITDSKLQEIKASQELQEKMAKDNIAIAEAVIRLMDSSDDFRLLLKYFDGQNHNYILNLASNNPHQQQGAVNQLSAYAFLARELQTIRGLKGQGVDALEKLARERQHIANGDMDALALEYANEDELTQH